MKRKTISIVNSGYGNIQSLINAFEYLDCKIKVLEKPIDIEKSETLVLPGVGSFNTAIKHLEQKKNDFKFN